MKKKERIDKLENQVNLLENKLHNLSIILGKLFEKAVSEKALNNYDADVVLLPELAPEIQKVVCNAWYGISVHESLPIMENEEPKAYAARVYSLEASDLDLLGIRDTDSWTEEAVDDVKIRLEYIMGF